MRKAILSLALAGAASAAPHDFPRACTRVFQASVLATSANQFEPKVSDAAGGFLVMSYTGAPIVGKPKDAEALIARYASSPLHHSKFQSPIVSFSLTKLSFVFEPKGDGCSVQLEVGMVTLESVNSRYQQIELQSNGSAETQWFSAIEEKLR